MRIIAWNCRGLGNVAAVRGLLDVQKAEDPDVLFLSETKMDEKRIRGLRWKLGLTNMIVKDCNGRSGGLAVFWRKETSLHVRGISRLYIDADVTEADGFLWRLTGFYGEPEKKNPSWRALRTLNAARRRPWLCLGDFNEVLMECEKEGGLPRTQGSMDRFREALEECGLVDLGFEGDPFTWRNNSHTLEGYIRERLDRAVACGEWTARFSLYRVRNGEPRHSDHRPIIVDTETVLPRRGEQGQHGFRFEASWVEEEQCAHVVGNAWRKAMEVNGAKVGEAIQSVAQELGDWSRNVLGDLEKRIKRAKKNLEECRRGRVSQENIRREEILKYKLSKLEDQKNTYWRQRAKAHWLQGGDRNTRFFHKYASERRRRSRIEKLVREDGSVVDQQEGLLGLISNYYNDLFTSSAGNRMDEMLLSVHGKVSPEMNHVLLEPYTVQEIKGALDAIGDLKAPGADGMISLFYKKHWGIVGDDVVKEVMNFLNGGDMPSSWNDTIMVLIPKTQKPERLKDLRPISLCNVIYKIVSKVLSNRLKLILPDIISPNQSAFVPGRLITDNILMAYGLTHFLRNKRRGTETFAALKLDMSKAYDRVEWDFLNRMMRKLGFHDSWVTLIMKCVTTVSYRVKVNGELTETISPTRGLRQGDPLSPYLFLICAEGFSALLNSAEEQGRIQGVTICENAPSINHLLFADDSLLLLKSNRENANHLKYVLQLYEECSGQTINKEKSSILFSRNCGEIARHEFLEILNMTHEVQNDRYLGLPVYMGRSR